MINCNTLNLLFSKKIFSSWANTLPDKINKTLDIYKKGINHWHSIIKSLPKVKAGHLDFNNDFLQIGSPEDCSIEEIQRIEAGLLALRPWRKGPFSVFGIPIDTEWRSNWKWNRLKDKIKPLDGKMVLDIGAGNGYYCWRMIGAGAELAIGIDPFLLYNIQFQAIKQFINNDSVHLLPLSIDDLPHINKCPKFDTVFSMGVLYHRKSPIDHLYQLKSLLKRDGELVLESLVIDGNCNTVLLPERRYAKMKNVWFIPSCNTLISWMKRCGFQNIRLISEAQTTCKEQRRTKWMEFESLSDFLDPEDSSLTIEGLPAPKRAIFLASKAK